MIYDWIHEIELCIPAGLPEGQDIALPQRVGGASDRKTGIWRRSWQVCEASFGSGLFQAASAALSTGRQTSGKSDTAGLISAADRIRYGFFDDLMTTACCRTFLETRGRGPALSWDPGPSRRPGAKPRSGALPHGCRYRTAG